MSGSSEASRASTTAWVPTGPTMVSGVGSKVMTQRVVITSFRSVMWSLCRWVSTTARRAPAWLPAPANRMSMPRPASPRNWSSPPVIKVAGPARFGSGNGLPVPSNVMVSPSVIDEPPGRLVRARPLGWWSLANHLRLSPTAHGESGGVTAADEIVRRASNAALNRCRSAAYEPRVTARGSWTLVPRCTPTDPWE